ncbi:MAG: hypothetical protein AB8B83_07905 [Bdellovibrionales bacterium]
MVDMSDGFELGQAFSGCDDLAQSIGVINSYNNGTAYGPLVNVDENGDIGDHVLFEDEIAGAMPIPLEDIARMRRDNLVDLGSLLKAAPGLEQKLDEIEKDLPYCGPVLLGSIPGLGNPST